MANIRRVDTYVNGKLIESKDFTNVVSADTYADERQRELDMVHANVRVEVFDVGPGH